MRRLLWDNPETMDLLKKELQKGSVILGEGDTVLGLLADVSAQGVAMLNAIKGRSKKPYLILVHDYKKALKLIQDEPKQSFQIEKLMNVCWPGPVTLIFKAKNTIPAFMKAIDGTIALRVPNHKGLLQLLAQFDGLFSTSANSSGKPVPSSINEIDESIMRSVSAIVLNGEHETSQSTSLPSTIIDCTGERLVVVRQGAFPIDTLIDMFGKDLFL
jgi:tRNA threonylcarbamoyl adenosine modification protein (Sua5/YciO/YrdC/YwlC family)